MDPISKPATSVGGPGLLKLTRTLQDAVARRLVFPTALRFRGEHSMWRHLEELQDIQYSEDELRRTVTSRLRELLVAASSVPAYSARIDHDLNRRGELPHSLEDLNSTLRVFPVLTKQDLQDRRGDLRAPGAGRALAKTTGGSTGQPVTVMKSPEGIARERAASWLAHGWFGLRPADRAVRFWGEPQTSGRRVRYRLADWAMNRKRLSAFAVDEERMRGYWQLLLKYRPQYLYGYAGMLEMFGRHLLDEGLDGADLDLAAVVSTAEPLTSVRRDVMREAFKAPVQNEYGCGEVGPIAYECPEGSLHVMSQNILMEIVRDDGSAADQGEIGHIIITDLNNRVMPLIRYAVGDSGSMGEGCACGRAFPTLEKVVGRTYDFLLDAKGRRYHGEAVMYVTEDLGSARQWIRGFQVVQREAGFATMRIVPTEVCDRAILRAELRDAFHSRLGGLEIEVEFVSEIESRPSGKTPLIVQEKDLLRVRTSNGREVAR